MGVEKLDLEKLREGVQDAVNLIKRLMGVCTTTEELIEVFELALVSDAQMKLIMKEAATKK